VDSAFHYQDFKNHLGKKFQVSLPYVDALGGGVNDKYIVQLGSPIKNSRFINSSVSLVRLPYLNGTVSSQALDTALLVVCRLTYTFYSIPITLKDFLQYGKHHFINIYAISQVLTKGITVYRFTDLRSESIIPGVNLNRQTLKRTD